MTAARIHQFVDQLQGLRVLVVGDVMLDHYVSGAAERISSEAPVPVIRAGSDRYVAGGAANVALNCAGLGARVRLVGSVGQDGAAETLRALLGEQGVDCSGLDGAAHRSTIQKMRIVAQRQQVCRVDREGAFAAYSLEAFPSLLSAEVLADFDVVIVSDYAKGVVTDPLLAHLRASAGSRPVCVDPKPPRPRDYGGAALLKPNRKEALQLAGLDPLGDFDAEAVVAALRARFDPEHLVITLGSDGMVLGSRGAALQQLPTQALEVFDVSGAGDTVIAVLSMALALNKPLIEAASLANAAAGVVVGHAGTFPISRAVWI